MIWESNFFDNGVIVDKLLFEVKDEDEDEVEDEGGLKFVVGESDNRFKLIVEGAVDNENKYCAMMCPSASRKVQRSMPSVAFCEVFNFIENCWMS